MHNSQQQQKSNVLNWVTNMVVEDCRPFSIVEDKGFLNLVQKMGDYA